MLRLWARGWLLWMLLGLTGLVLAADLGPARRVDIDYDSCTDFGPCEPCPVDLLDRNECKATGNRRLLQCGNIATWQACGKIITVERADYYEFLACITFFAVAGVVVVFWRSRRLDELRYRNLAARIGFGPRRGLARARS